MAAKNFRYLICIISVFILLFDVSGCRSSYEKFDLHGVDYHFSFEYPANYEKEGVSISYSRSLLEKDWKDSWFRVRVYEAGKYNKPDNAKAALNSYITSLSAHEEYSEFKILKRLPININGVIGEQCTLSYYYSEAEQYLDTDLSIKLPATLVLRCVYFDYNGFICEIRMSSIEEIAEQVDSEFGHLIETFEILD